MSSDVLNPADYGSEDGWDESRGIECCPVCGTIYSANGGYVGTVYDEDGTEYGHICDTDPDDGPYFCAECWDEMQVKQAQANHKPLTAFC